MKLSGTVGTGLALSSQRSLSKRSTFKLNRDAALTEWRSLIAS